MLQERELLRFSGDKITLMFNTPHGKESTEVRITQNKRKESENSYQKLMRSQQDRHMETESKYFDGHGHLSQSEESECM